MSTRNKLNKLNKRREIPCLQVAMYYSVYYINMTTFMTIFRRFAKILQNLSEGQAIVSELFLKISEDGRRFPKIIEDFRGRTDDVSTIQ